MTPEGLFRDADLGLVLDLIDGPDSSGAPSVELVARAHQAMVELEGGAVANLDEHRRVGHYWLRDASGAPDATTRDAIEHTWAVLSAGPLVPAAWNTVLLVGIGGSALGPQFLSRALASVRDPRRLVCLDNTDPQGIAATLGEIDLAQTVVVVVSKSGGTPETRNGMLATQAAYRAAGIPFHAHAIAITGPGSKLDQLARDPKAPWREVFGIFDWVGGRTSVTGPVGLVPMALCGWDWQGFLEGARAMDVATRRSDPEQNPAMRLASAWYAAGGGRGDRALVLLPYRDQFALLGRYLQQLVMESIGKRLDRSGVRVDQGLTVYGNKGSTDQHAYVQQVRDGRDDTFVHFVDTRLQGPRIPVDDGFFADDYLVGFLLGTRAALRERGRPSVTIQVEDCSARSVGQLVALFERAVGLYAELVDVNAYHQPGVEGGKRAARFALTALQRLQAALEESPQTASQLGGTDADVQMHWRLLHHLAATGRAVVHPATGHGHPFDDRFSAVV